MDIFFAVIGTIVCVLGGGALCVWLVAFLFKLAFYAWESASNEFRAICKAESLIFEYKKERDEYLQWKKGKEVKP